MPSGKPLRGAVCASGSSKISALLCVDGVVNNIPAKILIDSGSSQTLVTPKFASDFYLVMFVFVVFLILLLSVWADVTAKFASEVLIVLWSVWF